MPKRVNAFVLAVPAVFFVLVAFVFVATIVASIYSPTLAESTCIEQRNQPAPEGARWNFRYDRAKGRKCWFLEDAPANVRDASTPQVQASTDQPTLSSRLSSLFASLTGSSASVAPQGNAPQSNAPQSNAPQSNAPQSSATIAPRRTQGNSTNAARMESGVRADQKDIAEGHAGKRALPALTQADRIALFEEFLQWQESRQNINRLTPPPQ